MEASSALAAATGLGGHLRECKGGRGTGPEEQGGEENAGEEAHRGSQGLGGAFTLACHHECSCAQPPCHILFEV